MMKADAASSLGIKASYVSNTPISIKAGMRFDGQAQFHPRKYLLAWRKKFQIFHTSLNKGW